MNCKLYKKYDFFFRTHGKKSPDNSMYRHPPLTLCPYFVWWWWDKIWFCLSRDGRPVPLSLSQKLHKLLKHEKKILCKKKNNNRVWISRLEQKRLPMVYQTNPIATPFYPLNLIYYLYRSNDIHRDQKNSTRLCITETTMKLFIKI